MKNIVYRIGNTTRIIPITNVTAFESAHKYTSVHHADGEAVISDPLKKLETQLPNFIRISRSTLVDKSRITRMERSGIQLFVIASGRSFPVSRRYHATIRRWFRGEHAASNA